MGSTGAWSYLRRVPAKKRSLNAREAKQFQRQMAKSARRQRPSKLAISLAHSHTDSRRCYFSFFLSSFLCLFLRCRGNGLHTSTRFPGKKKTCTLLFAKIHTAIVPGLKYATQIAPSFKMHSSTRLNLQGEGGGWSVSKHSAESIVERRRE